MICGSECTIWEILDPKAYQHRPEKVLTVSCCPDGLPSGQIGPAHVGHIDPSDSPSAATLKRIQDAFWRATRAICFLFFFLFW